MATVNVIAKDHGAFRREINPQLGGARTSSAASDPRPRHAAMLSQAVPRTRECLHSGDA